MIISITLMEIAWVNYRLIFFKYFEKCFLWKKYHDPSLYNVSFTMSMVQSVSAKQTHRLYVCIYRERDLG